MDCRDGGLAVSSHPHVDLVRKYDKCGSGRMSDAGAAELLDILNRVDQHDDRARLFELLGSVGKRNRLIEAGRNGFDHDIRALCFFRRKKWRFRSEPSCDNAGMVRI
jgi:hypothetical protein